MPPRSGQGESREASDTDRGDIKRERQAARGGDADANAGERAGPGCHGDALKSAELHSTLGNHRLDHRHQPFGMAAAEILFGPRDDFHKAIATACDGYSAVRPRCVDGK